MKAMKTVIYINQDTIQLVRSNGQSTPDCTEIEMAVGTVLNGVIVKEAEILEKLEEIKKLIGTKPVTLIIDSSNMTIKKIETPDIKIKHLDSVVRGEIEVRNEDDYVFDYSILESEKKKGHTLIGTATQKEFIEKYINLFKQAKIKLENIDVAINGIVKYVYQNENLTGESFIINIIAKNNMMLSLIFENGKFESINRNRLIQEQETEEFVQEIFSKMSSMLQHNKSKSEEYQIKKSYYVGVSEETVLNLSAYAKQIDVEISPFMERQVNNDCFFACCGVHSLKNDIDLAVRYEKATKKTKASSGANPIQALVLLVLAAGVGGYWFTWDQKNLTLRNEINPMQNYIDSTAVLEAQIEVARLTEARTWVEAELIEYEEVIEYIAKSRVIDPEMLKLAFGQLEIDAISYVYGNRSIALTGTGYANTEPADYAEMMRNSGYFSNLIYTGYEVSENEEADSTSYTFAIEATLAELVFETEEEEGDVQ